MPEVILLNEIDEVKEHLASNQLAVVNVSATWCGPCRALAPHFNQLAAENDNVAFCKGKLTFKMNLHNGKVECRVISKISLLSLVIFEGKIITMITRVKSRIFTNSPYIRISLIILKWPFRLWVFSCKI